jgi:hypothetical protein
MKINYIIGLRSGDIGDYAPPSEKIYSEIFNRTGLETLVHIHYVPRSSNEISLNNDQISFFPFDYRTGGPFYGVKCFIKRIEMTWSFLFLVGLVDYFDNHHRYINHMVNLMFSLLYLLSKTVRI